MSPKNKKYILLKTAKNNLSLEQYYKNLGFNVLTENILIYKKQEGGKKKKQKTCKYKINKYKKNKTLKL